MLRIPPPRCWWAMGCKACFGAGGGGNISVQKVPALNRWTKLYQPCCWWFVASCLYGLVSEALLSIVMGEQGLQGGITEKGPADCRFLVLKSVQIEYESDFLHPQVRSTHADVLNHESLGIPLSIVCPHLFLEQ